MTLRAVILGLLVGERAGEDLEHLLLERTRTLEIAELPDRHGEVPAGQLEIGVVVRKAGLAVAMHTSPGSSAGLEGAKLSCPKSCKPQNGLDH